MKTKELKIIIPENHEIDWQESAKQEKIVFKKINTKPRSWEEYCEQTLRNGKYFIGPSSNIIMISHCCENETLSQEHGKNILPSKELAEAFLAMMQLMSLRQAWIGDWKPDWTTDNDKKYCIIFLKDKLCVEFYMYSATTLSFPTKEMALDFLKCFKDLLEIAKPLI